VGGGIQELVAVPARGQRTGLRLAVADDTGDGEIRIVEYRAEGVTQRIAELASLVDGAGCLRGHVARDAAGEGELLEEFAHPLLVPRDVGIALGVAPLEIGVADERRPAVARARDVDHLQVVLADDPVEMHIDEVLSRSRTPMPEEAWLDVARFERL